MSISDLEFNEWLREHGMEPAAPLTDKVAGLIYLVVEGLGSKDMREFLGTFLSESVQMEPEMSLNDFAELVVKGLNADLSDPSGGFLKPRIYRIN